MKTAKVFWSGRSQAVRLPKEFRLDAREAGIRRHGRQIILWPLPDSWSWLDAIAGTLDEDFVQAALEQSEMTERPDSESLQDRQLQVSTRRRSRGAA
jgi:antitoxin VapB